MGNNNNRAKKIPAGGRGTEDSGAGKRRKVKKEDSIVEDDVVILNGYGNVNSIAIEKHQAGAVLRRRKSSPTPVIKDSWWTKYEVPRKAFHSSIGFLTIYLWVSHAPVAPLIKFLSSACAGVYINDLLRLRFPELEAINEKIMGPIMRESEKTGINGTVWYLIGVVVVLSALPRDLAVLSILMLSWVDTAASVVGRTWGYLTPKLPPPFGKRKSLAGFIGAFVCGTLTAYSFYAYLAPFGHENDLSIQLSNISPSLYPTPADPTPWGRLANPNSTLSLPVFSLICGLIAAVSEAIDIWTLDDNVTIPILFGGISYAAMRILG